MSYRLGLDIGIASVGWSVMGIDSNNRPNRILDFGVRVFPPAEIPKTGDSPTVERREARGIRRNIRRRRLRLDKIKALLEHDLLNKDKIDFSYCDVYALRVEALDKRLSDNELARVLYSLSKHRGFKSNRKSELQEKDTKNLLGAINLNSQKAKSYRTIGEMFLKADNYVETRCKIVDGKKKEYKLYKIRNKAGDFSNTLLRDDILNEIRIILDRQKELGNVKITDEFKEKFLHYFTYQKSYDIGPDYPSPYQVNFNVGNCTFFKDEKRAAKATFTYEYFSALCDINNLSIENSDGKRRLTDEERELVINKFLTSKAIKYADLRKILKLNEKDVFKGKSNAVDDKNVFIKRPFTYDVCKILGFKDDIRQHEAILNEIAFIISMYKSDDKRLSMFKKSAITKELNEETLNELCALDMNKFGNLSIKAMKLINVYLEKGEIYTQAYKSAGIIIPSGMKMRKLKYNLLPEIEDITSPVVKRAVSVTIKIINAVIDKYGSPSAIYIELAREMSKNFNDRRSIEKKQLENFKNNQAIIDKLKEIGIAKPNGQDIIKMKLYEEQNGCCIYSGKSFISLFGSFSNIFKNNNTQIDHIIPFSKCFNDSLNNKVLVLASENQNKGNRLPYEYIGQTSRWQDFEDRVNVIYQNKFHINKRNNLLKKSLSSQQIEELNNRALNDTRYIAKFMKSLVENHLEFEENKNIKKPVRVVNGQITSFLRKIWGIKKDRFENDTHHAVDACIVACVDNGLIQRVSTFMQTTNMKNINNEAKYIDAATGEILDLETLEKEYGKRFQLPYEEFRDELKIRLLPNVLDYEQQLIKLGYFPEELKLVKPLYVSRMVNHKVTGAMHKATIRSKKLFGQTGDMLYATVKTPISKLKLDKNGEIDKYPEKYRKDDMKLYEALKQRLIEAKGNGNEAFIDNFYKPAKKLENRNIVKSVKLQEKISDPIEINNGVAENGAMIRVDFFKKDNKYYFIPVYTADYYRKRLPNKICKCKSPYKDWLELDETYEFCFSLFKNDLIKIKFDNDKLFSSNNKEKEVKLNDIFAYFVGADRSSASIEIKTINGDYSLRGLGIQKLIEFEKYQIDFLGNISKAPKESRKEFK